MSHSGGSLLARFREWMGRHRGEYVQLSVLVYREPDQALVAETRSCFISNACQFYLVDESRLLLARFDEGEDSLAFWADIKGETLPRQDFCLLVRSQIEKLLSQ